MYLYQIACCTILLAIAVSAYPGGHAESYANLNQYHHGGGHHDHHGHHEEEHHDYHAPAHYKYEYAVKDPHTGDHKQAWESRDGDKVKGSYSLYEPDGTKRIVDYTSDKHSGFNAHVQKIGHSTHDYIPHHHQHQHQHHDEHHGFGF